jgi:tRNA pseudouridine38-40 synthase
MVLSYEGTDFFGFQAQTKSGLRTVQGELNRVFQEVFDITPDLCVSGRTDRGVHASGQVVNFKWERELPFDKIKHALNAGLSDDVRVVMVDQVADDFHARYSARSKTYHYYFSLEPVPLYLRKFVTHVKLQLNRLDLMDALSDTFVGTHNFRNFKALGSFKSSDIKTIYEFKIEPVKQFSIWQEAFSVPIYCVEVRGSGFLYKMMRNIVGNCLEVMRGRRSMKDLQMQLSSDVKCYTYTTAPAQGLCLVSVEY